jgi:uncharacterized protein
MPASRTATAGSASTLSLAERVRTELELIRATVSGVYGSLVATSDGFLVAHDLPDLEPTEIAALVATTRALATRSTLAAGRGEFREATVRGALGYLVTYAAGSSAIVAVIGTNELNIGMLQIRTREIVRRIAASTPEFRKWTATTADGSADQADSAGSHAAAPPPLPRRRPGTR